MRTEQGDAVSADGVLEMTDQAFCQAVKEATPRSTSVIGYAALNALAEHFGLPEDCCGLDIHMPVDGVVTLTVHRVLLQQEKDANA